MGFLLMWLTGMPTLGQSLFVTPTQTEFDQIDLLTGFRKSNRLSLEARSRFHYDSNVEDFARAAIHHPSPIQFGGSIGYFTSDQTQEFSIAKGYWQITIANVESELYRGNHDAAQLYLDSVSRTINTNGVYNPNMTLNRSKATRLRVNYTAPIHLRGMRANIQATGNLLSFKRAQLGSLKGSTVNGQFHGDIELKTTLGLPEDQVDSYGASLDTGISFEVRPNLRMSASVENLLGQVWQGRIQHILTTVTTNTLVPNSDGFLQGAPLLSGKVIDEGFQSSIRKRYSFGTAYQNRGCDWLALLNYDFDWRINVGVNMHLKRRQRLWILLCPEPFQWQLGYEIGGLRLQFGISSIDLGTSHRGTAQVSYRLLL